MANPMLLVVDDDAPTLALMSAVGRRFEFDVVTAPDGAEAIEIMQTQQIDVLLLDLFLPKRNGFEVLDYLRATNPGLLARTIVITAASDAAIGDRPDLRRVFSFWRKPLDISLLACDLQLCAAASRRRSPAPVVLIRASADRRAS
jgi:CheY-like chemotaxis protein